MNGSHENPNGSKFSTRNRGCSTLKKCQKGLGRNIGLRANYFTQWVYDFTTNVS